MKKIAFALLTATLALSAAPASATFYYWGGSSGGYWSGSHSHYPGCGHSGTTTTGGTTTTTSTSSGGTEVPEPGMLGMFGLGLAALGVARLRRRKA